MNGDVREFAQVMAVLLPSFGLLVAILVIAIRSLRTKRVSPPPTIDESRLTRLEQSVDAIALEEGGFHTRDDFDQKEDRMIPMLFQGQPRWSHSTDPPPPAVSLQVAAPV